MATILIDTTGLTLSEMRAWENFFGALASSAPRQQLPTADEVLAQYVVKPGSPAHALMHPEADIPVATTVAAVAPDTTISVQIADEPAAPKATRGRKKKAAEEVPTTALTAPAAPAHEPEPEPEVATALQVPTDQEIRDALSGFIAKTGGDMARARKILQEFGCEKVSDVIAQPDDAKIEFVKLLSEAEV